MKVNYDFYTGQDNYCDGDVEKDVIEYTEKYSEKDFDKIFEYDVRWPVFYHLTSLRKNIIIQCQIINYLITYFQMNTYQMKKL